MSECASLHVTNDNAWVTGRLRRLLARQGGWPASGWLRGQRVVRSLHAAEDAGTAFLQWSRQGAWEGCLGELGEGCLGGEVC
eukprot:COSAG02_NODE_908_length_16032_cov_53.699931_8_plen_82_part_00